MAALRVAIRCDGGRRIGAGHVGRCLPIAHAFDRAGANVVFVGDFDGLAASRIQASGLTVSDPFPGVAAGLDPAAFDAAVVDLYGIPEAELCTLTERMPVATVAEAARCHAGGVHIDFHLDRRADESGPSVLAGAEFVPVDPAFRTAARARSEVERVLVTLGASDQARRVGSATIAAAAAAFPQARLLVAGGLPRVPGIAAEHLDGSGGLVELAGEVDVAVTAAGMTAYELACAGVPMLALVLVDNQRRVGAGIAARGIGKVLDVRSGIDADAVGERLQPLHDRAIRESMSVAGRTTVDGRGAERVVAALAERWDVQTWITSRAS